MASPEDPAQPASTPDMVTVAPTAPQDVQPEDATAAPPAELPPAEAPPVTEAPPPEPPPAELPPAEAPPVTEAPPPEPPPAEAPPVAEAPPTEIPPPVEPPPLVDTPPPVEPGASLVATDDTALAEPGSLLIIRPGDLLANDTLPTGAATVVGVGEASHGTVQLDQANDLIIFDATDGFFGSGGFSYTITDPSGAQATARVNVGIVGEVGAGAPHLADDQVTTPANQTLAIPNSQLLANDRSPGPEVVLSGVSNPVHGTVALDPASGTITFTPEQNFVGQAGFDYLATASSIGAIAHVDVAVTAPPPDALDDVAIIQGNQTAILPAALLLANDEAGLPGAAPRISSVGAPEHGSVGLNRGGDVVFSPEHDFVGDAGFAYTVTDRFGGSDNATVLLHVNEAPPDAPAQPQPPVVNITQTATITQVAILNQIIQTLPATPRVPASDGDDGGGASGGDSGAPQGLDQPVQAYFTATSQQTGAELWGYDGNSVAELADISRGAPSSQPADMVAVGGNLLFSAADLAHGREPWVFDGASARQLGDLNPGDEGSDPTGFTLAGRTLYFTADDGSHGRELWSASAGSVRMVDDLAAGPQGADPAQLIAVNDTLFFSADDGVSGAELWRVSAGQTPNRFADLNPGEGASAPDALTEVNGSLYFIADDGVSGRELYELRPGAAQPVQHELSAGEGGSFAEAGRTEPLAELDGRLYAVAMDGDGGASLWVSGADGGAVERVAELGGDMRGRVVSVETETAGNALYVALSDSAGGHALARYDAATGQLAGDVAGDPATSAQNLTAVGGSVFYTQSPGDGGVRTLWQDDGSGAQRVSLAGEGQPHDFAAVGGKLAFNAGGRLGVVDPDGAAEADFLSAGGGDYSPTHITAVHQDGLMLV